MNNAHLAFDMLFGKLTALSKAKGLRYPHPSGFRKPYIWTSLINLRLDHIRHFAKDEKS
jgi:hypothetical protein